MPKRIFIRLTTNAQHFRMYKQHLGKKRVKLFYEFSYVAKEEAMDSSNSTLHASYQLHPTSSFYVIVVGTVERRV